MTPNSSYECLSTFAQEQRQLQLQLADLLMQS